MNEIWKPIPGYEGIYDASNFGRVRSTPGKTTSNARYPVRVWKSRIIKPKNQNPTKRADARVTLWKDGKHTDYLVSRLVAMTFLGIPEENMTVNHINGDYRNNCVENLEWVSLAENIKHGFRTGLYASVQIAVSLISQQGEELSFPSMSSASRWLGHGSKYISGRLAKDCNTARSASGVVYRILPFCGDLANGRETA